MNQVLGFDIGGTGIKSAIVDTTKGTLITPKEKVATPQPATLTGITKVLKHILKKHHWQGSVGIGFPGSIVNGLATSANNLDSSWCGININQYFHQQLNCKVSIVNDADAAGLAELYFGCAKGVSGTVVLLTIGTGIGSSIFVDGKLLSGSELGQLYLPNGLKAELYTSNKVRKAENLDWMEWGQRLNIYLHHIQMLFAPACIILGGGASARSEYFIAAIDAALPLRMAETKNTAGVIGAALATTLA